MKLPVSQFSFSQTAAIRRDSLKFDMPTGVIHFLPWKFEIEMLILSGMTAFQIYKLLDDVGDIFDIDYPLFNRLGNDAISYGTFSMYLSQFRTYYGLKGKQTLIKGNNKAASLTETVNNLTLVNRELEIAKTSAEFKIALLTETVNNLTARLKAIKAAIV